MILFILLAILIAIITTLVVYARWNYGTLEALGIPVVKPYFILGSTPDLHLKVAHFEDIKRFKQYGPVYGVYEGRTPQIHICDPELVRQIYVKDFEHFHDRRKLELGNPLLNELIDFIPGEKWRVVRTMLTPTLSASRVKVMIGTTKEVVLEFVERMKSNSERNGQNGVLKVEVRSLAAELLIDYLARCSFGIKVGNVDDPNNYFIQTFKEITGNDKDFDLLYNLSLTFPILTKFAPTLDTKGSDKFVNTFRAVLKERRESKAPKINDLADKLNEMLDLLDTPEYKKLGITENTVFAQAVGGFFLAAYDSIITVLTMLPHFLAINPRAEEKVQRELKSFFESHGDNGLDFEHLPELEYLGACITEVLRLVPPFIRPERVCTKDWSHQGLQIKKGQVIMLPAWAYHRNPDIFENPDKFYPERFLDENKSKLHPYGFSTFGFGPRSCAGIRFANDSMKMCLAYIFKEFQFRIRPETKIEYKPGVLFLLMYGPVYMDMVSRG